MKKIIYGALIGLLIAIVMLSVEAGTSGAPILTYVYSNSMEPLIKVNDAFIVRPASKLKVGDIIMYRPVVLKAPYITHRIIGTGENGFITKGDNSPYPDQEGGEPEVTADRIAGKVFTIQGQPFIIPGLGNLTAKLKSGLGNYTKYLSVVFFILGVLSLFIGSRRISHRRKPRRRWRLKHLYRAITVIAIILVIVSIYAGSRVSQVKYLVSEYPGNLGDQIEVGKPGQLIMKVNNNGLVPVWTVLTGIAPLSIGEAPDFIPARSFKTIALNVLPHHETGIYQGYVQIYNYPVLLPRSWILYLHALSPVLAIIATGITIGLWFTLFFKLLNHVHGFEDWIPIRAIRDKLFARRRKRLTAKLLGRRRVR